MDKKQRAPKTESRPRARRRYSPPRLVRVGKVYDVTLGGTEGNTDGFAIGSGPIGG